MKVYCDNHDFRPVVKDYHFLFSGRISLVVPDLAYGVCSVCGETEFDAAACDKIDSFILNNPEAATLLRVGRKKSK